MSAPCACTHPLSSVPASTPLAVPVPANLHLNMPGHTCCGYLPAYLCMSGVSSFSFFTLFLCSHLQPTHAHVCLPYGGTHPLHLGNGCCTLAIIDLDCVAWATHPFLVYRPSFIPEDLHFSDSLDASYALFMNQHIDHHSYDFIK